MHDDRTRVRRPGMCRPRCVRATLNSTLAGGVAAPDAAKECPKRPPAGQPQVHRLPSSARIGATHGSLLAWDLATKAGGCRQLPDAPRALPFCVPHTHTRKRPLSANSTAAWPSARTTLPHPHHTPTLTHETHHHPLTEQRCGMAPPRRHLHSRRWQAQLLRVGGVSHPWAQPQLPPLAAAKGEQRAVAAEGKGGDAAAGGCHHLQPTRSWEAGHGPRLGTESAELGGAAAAPRRSSSQQAGSLH